MEALAKVLTYSKLGYINSIALAQIVGSQDIFGSHFRILFVNVIGEMAAYKDIPPLVVCVVKKTANKLLHTWNISGTLCGCTPVPPKIVYVGNNEKGT